MENQELEERLKRIERFLDPEQELLKFEGETLESTIKNYLQCKTHVSTWSDIKCED